MSTDSGSELPHQSEQPYPEQVTIVSERIAQLMIGIIGEKAMDDPTKKIKTAHENEAWEEILKENGANPTLASSIGEIRRVFNASSQVLPYGSSALELVSEDFDYTDSTFVHEILTAIVVGKFHLEHPEISNFQGLLAKKKAVQLNYYKMLNRIIKEQPEPKDLRRIFVERLTPMKLVRNFVTNPGLLK